MTKHRKIRFKCVLWVALHSSPTSANHAWRLGFLFTLLVFCRDGAFAASSGTWKATGVEEGLVSNSPFNHSPEQLLQLLPDSYKAGTGLSLTDTSCTCPIWYKHWQYTLGSWRPDKMGSEWEAPPTSWAVKGEIGGSNHRPPSQLLPGSHLLHHLWKWVSTHEAEAGSSAFWLYKGIYLSGQALLSSCQVKDLPQLATWPTLASSVPSGFSHIWFKHATTQFSANS